MHTYRSLLALLALCASAGAAPKPNIVVILVDDMGFSDLGCYGSEIPTPNLDALAKNGLRFTQFYNTARCCPTRAALLTGLYPHQTGVGWMTDVMNSRLVVPACAPNLTSARSATVVAPSAGEPAKATMA